jgi:hypothetical protein
MRGFLSECACWLRRSHPLSHCQRFQNDSSGAVLIYTGLIVAVLLGFGGLAVDAGMWYATKRSVQSAADAAAIAGSLEVARGNTTEVKSRAKGDAEKNLGPLVLDCPSEVVAGCVDINNPPASGPSTGVASAVEAIVRQPVPGFLSSVIYGEPVVVAARSVASTSIAEACVYVMDPSEDSALYIRGTAQVDMDCGAQVNSNSPIAIDQDGAGCMDATSLATVGGADGDCLAPTPEEDMPETEDPFAYLTAPAAAADPCDYTTLVQVTSPTTLDPGNYCGGLVIEADVTFNPGEYVMDGEGLQIQGNSTVTGDEVSFYFPDTVTGYDPPGPTPPQSLYMAGTTAVDLGAPTTGDYQGVLFYHDQNVDPNIQLVLQGGADMELEGIVYAKNNHMRFAGGTGGVGGWLTIAVDTLEFTGNTTINGATAPSNLPLALMQPTLVE